jgi:RNA polymerase sigma-70 factor (ECF subfamily)
LTGFFAGETMHVPQVEMSLEQLLEQLNNGDYAAAERIFVVYESYLRLIVRRQISAALRAKFDSVDIVQSVWVDLLAGFREAGWRFADPAQLRAFLIRTTRNRFIDRLRQHQHWLEREQPLADLADSVAPHSADAAPSEEVQAREVWARLLKLCPPDHRELLRLKQQGFSLGEIAERTGLHSGSVRRILSDLARRFARQAMAQTENDIAQE